MANITAGQSQGLYFRQLPVGRLGRDQGSQGAESRVHAAQRRSRSFRLAHPVSHIALSIIRPYLVRYKSRYKSRSNGRNGSAEREIRKKRASNLPSPSSSSRSEKYTNPRRILDSVSFVFNAKDASRADRKNCFFTYEYDLSLERSLGTAASSAPPLSCVLPCRGRDYGVAL